MIDLFSALPSVPLPSPESFVQEYFVDYLGPNLTAFFAAFAGVTVVKMLIFRR